MLCANEPTPSTRTDADVFKEVLCLPPDGFITSKDHCPEGTNDNSPAFQRWVRRRRTPSPEGTPANPKGIPQQSPGLRGTSYPGPIALGRANPNGVVSASGGRHNPVGVETWFARFPRVARRLATLGWRTQSLWDWPRRRSGLAGNDKALHSSRITFRASTF